MQTKYKPELFSLTRATSNDLRQLRSMLRSLLGFDVRFREDFSHSFYQSYGDTVLTGKIIFLDKKRHETAIQLNFS